MHQCLCVSEILEAIFYFVFDDKRRYRLCSHLSLPDLIPSAETRDRRSIFRLALTCRAFRDLALDVLYSHLRNFWPLILPSRPSRLHHTPELFRPLVLASRIQILSQPCQDDTTYPSFFACAQKQAPLFPNLRSLAWRDCSLTCIPVLKLLLPTVEILSLDLSSSFRKAIIPALPTSAPRLKALEIKGSLFMTDKNPSEIESLLISYPDGLTELSLTCHWHDVPSTVLNVIAPWPSLRSLTLKLGLESIPTTPLHIVPQPFPALTDLHISSDDTLDLLISFLRTFRILKCDSSHITFPNLKTIHFNAEGCSTVNTWSQFLTSLAHTNTYLEHIIITEQSYGYKSLPPSSFDFRLLLAHPSLARLSTLFLSPGRTSTITLTDADILTLARTCRHLHSLGLGLRNTAVSLHALNSLIRRCRELREVSLCVDARVDTLRDSEHADDEDEVGLQPNTCLIKLEVGSSPIAYVGSLRSSPELTESIPRFLHAMAPRLKNITVTDRAVWSHGTSENPWQVVSDAFWMMVTDEEDH